MLGKSMWYIGMGGSSYTFIRKGDAIRVIISLEMLYIGINIEMVDISVKVDDINGQVYSIYIITVIAGETAIGLGIVYKYYRATGRVKVEDMEKIKG